ncbi:CDK5 and ABL1 enzyme substrate 1, partial [Coelomomyces lativittatus]
MEISTIATAYVYFEKLVLKRIVEKANRRFVAAICVLLASKINEPKGFPFPTLFQTLSKELGVSMKEIRDHEFYIYSQLEFHLYLPFHELFPHFDRILTYLNTHHHANGHGHGQGHDHPTPPSHPTTSQQGLSSSFPLTTNPSTST